MIAGVY
jgi:group I intron endonuclease